MTTAALYARVSTRDKDQDPETQLLQLREWAARQQLEAIEYVDHASGGDLNRPGWQSMMAAVRKGRVDVVAVVRLDRAFRSVPDLHATLAELEGRGIRFAATTQPIDTGTPVGRLMITVLGAVAEFERDLTRDRVREGLARARRDGKSLGRPRRRISDRRIAEAVEEAGGIRPASRVLGIPESTLRLRVRRKGSSGSEAAGSERERHAQ